MSKIGLQKSADNMVAWMDAILYPTSNKKYDRYNATNKILNTEQRQQTMNNTNML